METIVASDYRIMFNKETTWWQITYLKEVPARQRRTV